MDSESVFTTSLKPDDDEFSREFFGNMLISQLNTIESVGRLEYEISNEKEKTNGLKSAVESLNNKCRLLEDTIEELKNMLISTTMTSGRSGSELGGAKHIFNSWNGHDYVPLSPSASSTLSEKVSSTSSSFKSLMDVCTNLYREEGFDSKTTSPQENDDDLSASSSEILCTTTKTRSVDDAAAAATATTTKTVAAATATAKSSFYHNCCHRCSTLLSSSLFLRRRLCLDTLDDKDRAEPLSDDEKKEIQRLFNKRVKYEVNRKFGRLFLAKHQVRELDVKQMLRIKKKVLRIFSPFPLSIKAAWSNAMNSLRQDRHQLKKKKLFVL